MDSFFYGIADLFVNVLFAPFVLYVAWENWWEQITLNWIFMLIGATAFITGCCS